MMAEIWLLQTWYCNESERYEITNEVHIDDIYITKKTHSHIFDALCNAGLIEADQKTKTLLVNRDNRTCIATRKDYEPLIEVVFK